MKTHRDQETKQRIIHAAVSLLNESEDPDYITVRQIAERAEVGIGLINYHFQSKDTLLYTAVGDKMAELALKLQGAGYTESNDPIEKLKNMLIDLTDFAAKYEKVMKIAVAYELHQGKFQAPLFLVPVLKEILPARDEMALRVIAFQILTALQVASLQTEEFRFYSGLDLYNKAHRDRFIGMLVENAISQRKER